ncbi:MAG: MMPL family transporter, partial [Chloroflexi bacterium]|nr:MMPL family transporter [Chloroflexota bacterium]
MRLPSTQSLASASARHPWRTVGLWLVLIVLAGYAGSGLGDVTSDENRGNSESDRANELISRLQVSTGPATEFVVVESASPGELPLDQAVLALSRDLLALPETTRVSSFVNGRADLLSADRGTALIEVELAPGSSQARAVPIVEWVRAADEESDLRVTVVGEGSVNGEIDRLAEETLLKGEIIGVSLALVILLVVMGTVVAALIPIVLAAGSIIVAMGAAALVGEVTGLNELVQNIIVLIGLAVGIDYSFFIVQRYREERGHGLDNLAAITRAGGTASRAVLFSGVAVAIALAGMFIIPFDIFRSLAIGAILVVVAAVAAALTLLPAILSLLGDRVNALPVPLLGRGRPGSGVGTIWSGVIRVVTRRPLLSVGLTTAGLAAVAAFFFTINLGANGIDTFPEDNDFRHALTVVNAQFSDGVGSADIVIEAEADSAGLASAIAALEASLEADPTFG